MVHCPKPQRSLLIFFRNWFKNHKITETTGEIQMNNLWLEIYIHFNSSDTISRDLMKICKQNFIFLQTFDKKSKSLLHWL